VPLDVRVWQADLVSLSGHKIGGPMGTGALWVRRGVRLVACQPGHQEQGLRAGTENVIALAGMGAAAACVAERVDAMARWRVLRDRLWQRLQEAAVHAGHCLPQRWGEVAAAEESGHVLTVGWPGVAAAKLVMALDLAGVAASAGSACSSGTTAPSALLLAMAGSADAARAAEAVRFSLGPGLDEAAIDTAAQQIGGIVARWLGRPPERVDPASDPLYAVAASR
jgi:cysteine desulfurase